MEKFVKIILAIVFTLWPFSFQVSGAILLNSKASNFDLKPHFNSFRILSIFGGFAEYYWKNCKRCNSYPVIPNGNLGNCIGTSVGKSCTVRCNSMYQPSVSSIQCIGDGLRPAKWRVGSVTCEKKKEGVQPFCRNMNNEKVDWYIAYRVPNSFTPYNEASQSFLYLSSENSDRMQLKNSMVLRNTLSILNSFNDPNSQLKFVLYNNERPEYINYPMTGYSGWGDSTGHAKGLLCPPSRHPSVNQLSGLAFDSQMGTVFTLFSKPNTAMEIYVEIAQFYNINAFVQTWRSGTGTGVGLPIPARGTRVEDLEEFFYPIHLRSFWRPFHNSWRRTTDHSKWLVGKRSNDNLLCVGDLNRMDSQMHTSGGAICMRHTGVANQFRGMARPPHDVLQIVFSTNI
ncbi:unnamed protein product [Orchesella dallaii]|uniref:Uncharacterized protein n=1 Tax=Orchesella dallaii TaxID=48710 RepID=A0ABP1RJ51_9HEXA